MERHTADGDALLVAMLKQKAADGMGKAAEFVGQRWGVGPTMQNLTRFYTGYDPDNGEDLTKQPLFPSADSGSRLGEIGAWFGQRSNAPVKRVTIPHLGAHSEMATVAPGPAPVPAAQGMSAEDAYQTMLNSEDPEAKRRAMVVYALRGGA